jgi:hypothetical protein
MMHGANLSSHAMLGNIYDNQACVLDLAGRPGLEPLGLLPDNLLWASSMDSNVSG